MTELRENVDAARVAASALLTGPGVPFVYYGEEIGMTGSKQPGDYLIRTPMQWEAATVNAGFSDDEPWHPVNDDFEAVNVALQQDDPNSLLSHYRTLIHLRNAHPALGRGAYIPVETESRRVYAFLRRHADETLLVVINFDDEPVTDYALTLAAGSIGTDAGITTLFGSDAPLAAPEVDANGQFTGYQPLPELAPFSTLIVQLGSGS
jgi:glycosidase